MSYAYPRCFNEENLNKEHNYFILQIVYRCIIGNVLLVGLPCKDKLPRKTGACHSAWAMRIYQISKQNCQLFVASLFTNNYLNSKPYTLI